MSRIRAIGLILAFALLLTHLAYSGPSAGADLNSVTARPDDARWGRDPFYRERVAGIEETVVVAPSIPAKLFLSAIIFREGIGVAIIDGRIVRQGDSIGKGFVVSEILTDKVFLLKGEQIRMLEVQAFGGH